MAYKNIPKNIEIGGVDVDVCECNLNGEAYGLCKIINGKIEIEKSQSESSKKNTFFHELTHSILYTMGEIELFNNEKFVSSFSGFLTESLKNCVFIENNN